MEENINENAFDDLDNLPFHDGGFDEMTDDFGEEEEIDHEWHPRFAVDMDNPVELTDIQKEHALAIYNSITAHIEAHPDDDVAPLICITQDWKVRVDYGGWVSDSDYRDSTVCVMCRDEMGFYINLEYVEQCVPFIEDRLKELAAICIEMYGRVPNHQEDENKRLSEAEMLLLSILCDEDLQNYGIDNVLIAIDTIECSIYPIPSDEEHDDYGGIIQYVPANTLISKDGEIEIDKIKALVRKWMI